MKKILKKRSVKIVLASICLITVAIIAGFAVRGNLQKKEISEHLNLAQKYLDELNYEQAIAEYEAILAIDPNDQEVQALMEIAAQTKEIRNLLEDAQSHLDIGEYDSAIAICEAAPEYMIDTLNQQSLFEQSSDYLNAKKLLEEVYQQALDDREEAEKEARKLEAKQKEIEKKEEQERQEEEKRRQKWEEPEYFYRWMMQRRGIFDYYPTQYVFEEDEESFIFFIYSFYIDVINEYYEIHVSKQTEEAYIVQHMRFISKDGIHGNWSEIKDHIGEKYDFHVPGTDMDEEYLLFCELQEKEQKYSYYVPWWEDVPPMPSDGVYPWMNK